MGLRPLGQITENSLVHKHLKCGQLVLWNSDGKCYFLDIPSVNLYELNFKFFNLLLTYDTYV